MNNDAARIAALEAENASLRAQIERLQPPRRVITIGGPFCPPTTEQMEKLAARVLAQYPMLRPDPDTKYRGGIAPAEFVEMCRSALVYLGSLYRLRGAVAREKSYMDWLLLAGDHLNAVGCSPTTLRGSSLMVAAIAAGDICYSPPRLWPVTADIGVAIGPASNRYTASNKWLALGAGGDLDQSLIIESPQLRHAPLSEFEIMRRGNWRNELQ
jgi:hypothetical protein